MDITATFLPVADQLINVVFPTPIRYIQQSIGHYDPLSGVVTRGGQQYDINAAVLARRRIEGGASEEVYELELWVEHRTLPVLPETSDIVVLDGRNWKVTEVNPSYSSLGLIASRIKARTS